MVALGGLSLLVAPALMVVAGGSGTDTATGFGFHSTLPGEDPSAATVDLDGNPALCSRATCPTVAAEDLNASNTGVPAGTHLTVLKGDLTIDTPGAVVNGLDIHGFVTVTARGVTIRNSIIRGAATSTERPLLLSASVAASVTIQDSELFAAFPSWAIDGIRGWNITATRVNIHDVVDGFHLYGDNVTVQSSWLHNNLHFASDPNQDGGPSHDDGIQIQVGKNIRIIGNNMSGAANSAVQFTQDMGIVSDVQIVKNRLDGGECTINVAEKGRGSFLGLVIVGNTFGRTTAFLNCAITAPPTTVIALARNSYTDGAAVTIGHVQGGRG